MYVYDRKDGMCKVSNLCNLLLLFRFGRKRLNTVITRQGLREL